MHVERGDGSIRVLVNEREVEHPNQTAIDRLEENGKRLAGDPRPGRPSTIAESIGPTSSSSLMKTPS